MPRSCPCIRANGNLPRTARACARGRPFTAAVTALLLAGCTTVQPGQQPAPAWRGGNGGYYAPPFYYSRPPSYAFPGVDAAMRNIPPPLSYFPPLIPRAEAQEPEPAPYPPAEALPAAPDEIPVDPNCNGWWRLCHLWSGS